MGDQAVFDGVEMYVIQMAGKILAVAHDMVVVAPLPKPGGCEAGPVQPGLGGPLEASDQIRNAYSGVWAQHEVKMVGQEHVGVVRERVQSARRAQRRKHFPACGGIAHPRAPALGDQGKEDGLPVTVVASVARHGGRIDAARKRRHRRSPRNRIRFFAIAQRQRRPRRADLRWVAGWSDAVAMMDSTQFRRSGLRPRRSNVRLCHGVR